MGIHFESPWRFGKLCIVLFMISSQSMNTASQRLFQEYSGICMGPYIKINEVSRNNVTCKDRCSNVPHCDLVSYRPLDSHCVLYQNPRLLPVNTSKNSNGLCFERKNLADANYKIEQITKFTTDSTSSAADYNDVMSLLDECLYNSEFSRHEKITTMQAQANFMGRLRPDDEQTARSPPCAYAQSIVGQMLEGFQATSARIIDADTGMLSTDYNDLDVATVDILDDGFVSGYCKGFLNSYAQRLQSDLYYPETFSPDLDEYFQVPRTIFTSDTNPNVSFAMTFARFTNASLFVDNITDSDDTLEIGSIVLSVSINTKDTTITDAIATGDYEFCGVYSYGSNLVNLSNVSSVVPSCVYYNTTTQQWQSDGCNGTVLSTTKQTIRCCCDHLTSFAVLVSGDTAASSSLSSTTLQSLTTATDVMIGISLFFVVLSITSIGVIGELRRNLRYQILLCTSISFAVVLVVFSFINPVDKNSTGTCMTISYILVYALIAYFCWLTVEALLLYQTFISQVYEAGADRLRYPMLWRCVYAWGLPLLVLLFALIDPDNMIKRNTDTTAIEYCWVNMSSDMKWLVYVPLMLTMVFNTAVFARVTILVVTQESKPTSETHAIALRRIVVLARIIGCLSAVTGITWAFSGVLLLAQTSSNTDFKLIVEVVFIVCVLMQGVLIFYFHIFKNDVFRSRVRLFVSESLRSKSKGAVRLKRTIDTSTLANSKTPSTNDKTQPDSFYSANILPDNSATTTQSTSVDADSVLPIHTEEHHADEIAMEFTEI